MPLACRMKDEDEAASFIFEAAASVMLSEEIRRNCKRMAETLRSLKGAVAAAESIASYALDDELIGIECF